MPLSIRWNIWRVTRLMTFPLKRNSISFVARNHCYGRSAFLMSGSGAFLYFHMGVVKALWSEGLLPHIMSGSSGGSIVGALISTHVDHEIPPFFEPENLVTEGSDEIASQTGLSIFGGTRRLKIDEIRERISNMIPDLTFQEAYELTGRHLNVSIAPAEKHQTSRLLNAIASPNVYIREAVMASCAVPGVYPPVTLAAKDHKGERKPYLPNRKWVDGSVTHDLPAKRLGRLYGVNHHIVSQANPLITPFATDVKQQRTPIFRDPERNDFDDEGLAQRQCRDYAEAAILFSAFEQYGQYDAIRH